MCIRDSLGGGQVGGLVQQQKLRAGRQCAHDLQPALCAVGQEMCIRDRSKTGAQFGSTKRGIAYAYGDKYMKKTLRMGDLLHLDDAVKKRLVTMVDSKNLVMEGSYNAAPISVDEMWAWLEKYAAIFKDYICDVGQYLADADAAGKKVLFEAQLGALRDIDFGIYPYTTSSNVIGAYAPIGAGIPGHKLNNSIGVMKAYSCLLYTSLTEAEKAEQQALRQEYLADIKASLRSQLERTSIQEPDGTIHKVTRRTDLTGERS